MENEDSLLKFIENGEWISDPNADLKNYSALAKNQLNFWSSKN